MHIISYLVTHIESFVASGGYWALFIISTLEALPIIGSIVPGQTAIILAGFLSKLGTLNVWYVFIFTILGATLGDGIAYFVGKKYGLGALTKISKYLFLQEEHIDKAKKTINAHTGKALILGRFNPVTRALTPFLVGVSGGHIHRFWFYNIIGAILWAGSSIFVGYIFGASYHAVAGYIGKFIGAGIVIGILIVWAYRFINSRWHIFVKYDLFTLGLNLFSLYFLFKTIQDTVGEKAFFTEIDLAINAGINSFINIQDIHLIGVEIAQWITVLGNVYFVAPVCFIAIAYLGFKRSWKNSWYVLLSLGGVIFWASLMKITFMRLRPENIFAVTDYSFPSFHAAAAAMGTILIIYIWTVHIKNMMWRELAIAGVFILGVAVAFSRIYLSVHWFSDVVAGYSLGIFWTTLSIMFVKYISAVFRRKK